MNNSLLISESIFVPVLDGHHRKDEDDSSFQNTYAANTSLFDHSRISSFELSKPRISMTQEEAMRLLHLAASLLQANIKRYFQQKRYNKMCLRHHAAVKIQCVWRGYRVRNLDVTLLQKKYQYLIKQFSSYVISSNKIQCDQFFYLKDQNEQLLKTLLAVMNDVDMLKSLKKSDTVSRSVQVNIKDSVDSSTSELYSQKSDDRANTANIPTLEITDEPVAELNDDDDDGKQIEKEERERISKVLPEDKQINVKDNVISEVESNSEFQNIEIEKSEVGRDHRISSESIDNISLPYDNEEYDSVAVFNIKPEIKVEHLHDEYENEIITTKSVSSEIVDVEFVDPEKIVIYISDDD